MALSWQHHTKITGQNTMKTNNFKKPLPPIPENDYSEFEEFLEYKRMKQQYEKQSNQAINNENFESETEDETDLLAVLGVISFILSGCYTFISESAKHKEFGIGAFIFLSFFYLWGYSINKPAFCLIMRFTFFLNAGWVAWKIGLFN